MSDTLQADPKILQAAEKLLHERGYHGVVLADVAQAAGVALPAVQSHYATMDAIFEALWEVHVPRDELRTVLSSIRGDNTASMVRQAIEGLVAVFDSHRSFSALIIIDFQVYDGRYFNRLFSNVASDSAAFITRLATMPGIRPLSTIMLGRVFVSLIVGFVVTQHMAPEAAQLSMRIFPQSAWVDGMTEIFLHGILAHSE